MEIEYGNEIGRGGFCIVYEAWRSANGQRIGPKIAYKVLQDRWTTNADVVARFQREVRLLDDELDHPHLVSVLHRNVSDDPPWFTMQFLPSNLEQLIETSGAIDREEAIRIFTQILEAVAHIHASECVHRDLKPANVLLTDALEVRVSDLGLGKRLGGNTELTETARRFGTQDYMPPEQFKEFKDLDPTADVFSLGKTLLRMLTAGPPTVGVPDASGVDEPFRYFIQRCCDQVPGNRFPDAGEALDVFLRWTEPATETTSPMDELEELIAKWFETPADRDLAVVREIDEVLRSNAADEAFITKGVPKLPEDLLSQYLTELANEFDKMLASYDKHLSGGLPFSYCDVVADLYSDIFRKTDRLALVSLLLTRLLDVGWRHNRYHVRDAVIDLVSREADPVRIQVIAETIQKNPVSSRWFAERALAQLAPGPVCSAFKALDD